MATRSIKTGCGGKFEFSRRILITTFRYFDIHKGTADIWPILLSGPFWMFVSRVVIIQKGKKSILDKTMTLTDGGAWHFFILSYSFTSSSKLRFQWRHVVTTYYQSFGSRISLLEILKAVICILKLPNFSWSALEWNFLVQKIVSFVTRDTLTVLSYVPLLSLSICASRK